MMNLRMLARLDRFLAKELLRTTVAGLCLAVVILLALQALRLSGLIIQYDLDFLSISKLVSGLAASLLPIELPVAFLFALLFLFGRMSTDREFIALQAMGHSPARLLVPIFFFGALVSAGTAFCSFYLGPRGNQAFEASIDEAFKKKVATVLRSGTFSENFLDLVVFVDDVDPETQVLHRVFIHDANTYQEQASISAEYGRWIQSKELGLGTLALENGILISESPKQEATYRVRFDEYRINADFSQQAGVARDSPPSLEMSRLLARRAAQKNQPGLDRRPVWIEIAQRFSISMACLIFVPLCFALSVDNRRTARSRAVLYGLLILLLYWTVHFTVITWTLKTPLDAIQNSEALNWLIVWIPNLLLATAAAYFYRRSFRLRR